MEKGGKFGKGKGEVILGKVNNVKKGSLVGLGVCQGFVLIRVQNVWEGMVGVVVGEVCRGYILRDF